jgi:hypothetical protein
MSFIFSTPLLIRHLWQLQTVVFRHWCLIRAVLLHDIYKCAHTYSLNFGPGFMLLAQACPCCFILTSNIISQCFRALWLILLKIVSNFSPTFIARINSGLGALSFAQKSIGRTSFSQHIMVTFVG